MPAPDRLPSYSRAQWPGFFRQIGAVTRAVHEVTGARFGPIAGPCFERWSEALVGYFHDAGDDLDDAGLESGDVRRIADAVERHRGTVDEITGPHLLHGDLWTVNLLLDAEAAEPTITGVLDGDRAWWGDPLADGTIDRALRRPGTERDAFWQTYGALPTTAGDQLRRHVYRARPSPRRCSSSTGSATGPRWTRRTRCWPPISTRWPVSRDDGALRSPARRAHRSPPPPGRAAWPAPVRPRPSD